MARTPLAQAVEDAASRLAAEDRSFTRRRLLAGAGAAVGAAALGRFAPLARGAAAPRVVVVGAGLAGLTCAYRLQQKGVRAEIYEAVNRIGGRCWTGRGVFDDGQIYEHGGELIDTGHRELRRLARELDLDLDNLIRAERTGTEMLGWFSGRPYTLDEMTADFAHVLPQLQADADAAGYPTTYLSSTPRGRELDRTSIAQYLDRYVPGGRRSRFGALLDVAYNIEYGAETNVQSALNLIYLIGFSTGPAFTIFGESDERFHIRGGNDQVPARLADRLDGQLSGGTPLRSIKLKGDGTYALTFADGAGSFTRVADHVVLALPFAVLRADVDWSRAGFNDVKAIAIREQGMGTNSKLHVQFSSRFWRDLGSNGDTFSDRGYQNTWEVTRAQDGDSGILVDYTGGTIGASFGSGTAASRARQFLRQIEPVLPGATAAWNGKATIDFWAGNPYTHGSYSYWKVGQYTRFSGAESERSGNCHFAGEHTSQDFQGYLNGAVQSGERAAAEILADLK